MWLGYRIPWDYLCITLDTCLNALLDQSRNAQHFGGLWLNWIFSLPPIGKTPWWICAYVVGRERVSSDYAEIQLFKPYCMGWCFMIKVVLIYFCSNLFSVANFHFSAIQFQTSVRDKKAKQIIAKTALPEIMLRLLSKINTQFPNVNIFWGEQSVSVTISCK